MLTLILRAIKKKGTINSHCALGPFLLVMSLTQDLKAIITLLIQIFVIFPYSALTIPRPSPRTATKPTRDTSDSEDSSVTMVSDRVHELCTSKQSVSALLAQDPTIAPGDAWKTLYGNLPSEAGSAGTEREDSTPDDLKRVAECGNWGPTQPSELFLKASKRASEHNGRILRRGHTG